jgi:hypothetical protein
MKKLPRTLGSSIKFLIACTLGACAPYGSLCADEMDCRDGNAADVDACVIGYESNEDRADLHGCIDFWDRYLSCHSEQAHCRSGDIWTDDGDCGDEWKDYADCVN